MTDRLAELEKLLARATPAPWEDASTDDGPFDYQVHTVADDSWSLIGLVPSPHDARLIARLVTAAPDLLAVAKAAREYRDRYIFTDWPPDDLPTAALLAALANLGGATCPECNDTGMIRLGQDEDDGPYEDVACLRCDLEGGA